MSTTDRFVLKAEFITLDNLLKATGSCSSGGEAKAVIAGGEVKVNGEEETRRGRKLRPGDQVQWGMQGWTVVSAA